jgi:hypothetical protein
MVLPMDRDFLELDASQHAELKILEEIGIVYLLGLNNFRQRNIFESPYQDLICL